MTDKADKVPKETTEMNSRVDENSMVLLRELSNGTKSYAFVTCTRIFPEGNERLGTLIHNTHQSNLKF